MSSRQSDMRFTLVFSDVGNDRPPPTFEVLAFQLDEGLSECFRLAVELSSADATVDFGKVLDQPVLFTLWYGEQAVRYVHGVVSEFSQHESGFRRTFYHAVVEPALARATLRSDWKIFQQQTVPQILQTVLKRSGISDVEQTLTKEHLPREYCVQPGETDLDFFQRLSAEEGLYYAFTHSATGHRLVQGDRLYVHGAIDGVVTYNPAPGGDQAVPCLRTFRYAEQVRTASQTQKDYTFKHPQYGQSHTSIGTNLSHQGRDYERYDYPGRYKQDEAGKPFTEARLLALRRDAQIATVEGDDARLVPGLAFDLDGHPREEWNTGWRTVRMTHTGTQTTSQQEDSFDATVGTHYSYTAEIIPDRVEWKPPQHPKPRIDGPQMATVVGPQGEEIFTDEYGRVKVQFPWDRDGSNDEHSSCWIRVSQNWAGGAWGHIAIPRVGHEVIVDYVDGDCDQPLQTLDTSLSAQILQWRRDVFGDAYNAADSAGYYWASNKANQEADTASPNTRHAFVLNAASQQLHGQAFAFYESVSFRRVSCLINLPADINRNDPRLNGLVDRYHAHAYAQVLLLDTPCFPDDHGALQYFPEDYQVKDRDKR